jgi:putative SOS response-associated peptidase YedK
MCGRYVSTSTPEAIASFFGATVDTDALPVNYNVAPTNDVYGVVAAADGHPSVRVFHWGLVPSWAKDEKIGSRMINARAETLGEKPAFRNLFATHRLLVPMDGFYEWKAAGEVKAVKQPMFIRRVDGQPLAVAGLWAVWRDRALGPDAPWLHSLTVVTTGANATMAPVHDRMPVVLPESAWQEWLDPANHDTAALQRLLVPAADDALTMHPVSTAVNNVRNKGEALIEPV